MTRKELEKEIDLVFGAIKETERKINAKIDTLAFRDSEQYFELSKRLEHLEQVVSNNETYVEGIIAEKNADIKRINTQLSALSSKAIQSLPVEPKKPVKRVMKKQVHKESVPEKYAPDINTIMRQFFINKDKFVRRGYTKPVWDCAYTVAVRKEKPSEIQIGLVRKFFLDNPDKWDYLKSVIGEAM